MLTRPTLLTRLGPILAIGLLTAPVAFGLAGTVLPAFGFLPVLGGMRFSLAPLAALFAEPAIAASALMSLLTGLSTALVSLIAVMLFTAAWSGTRAFARVQHLISPLLSVPHAAAAFALAFLIAPSGLLIRLVSPELTGWHRPPDVLIVHDPMGLTMMAGLIIKEIPFLLLMTLAALPQVKPARTRALIAAMATAGSPVSSSACGRKFIRRSACRCSPSSPSQPRWSMWRRSSDRRPRRLWRSGLSAG